MKSNNIKGKLYKILLTILIIIIIFLSGLLIIRNKSETEKQTSSEDENKDQREFVLKRRYFSLGKRLEGFSCLIPNSTITSVYIRTYEFDKTENDFFFVKYKGKTYKTNETKFLRAKDTLYNLPLVNIRFPFLNTKENIYPYLHPLVALRMLYIFSKVNFSPRLSDALRELSHQLKYKRRGWSDVDKSPHLLGLAFDMSKYTGAEKKIVEKLCEDLSLYFLQHGGRRNMHIHIQDDKVWTQKSISKNLISISDNLIKEYYAKESIFNRYELLDSAMSSKYLFPYKDSLINNTVPNNIYSFKINSNQNKIIKIEIINILGQKSIEIYTLIDNKKTNEFIVDLSFLAPGIYKSKLYEDNKLPREELIKIF